MISKGKINVRYCPTYNQAANIMTKGVEIIGIIRHGTPSWVCRSDLEEGCRTASHIQGLRAITCASLHATFWWIPKETLVITYQNMVKPC